MLAKYFFNYSKLCVISFFAKKVNYLPPKHASRTNSRNITGRNPSMVIPLFANKDLTPVLWNFTIMRFWQNGRLILHHGLSFKLYRTVYRATSNMRRILRSLAIKEQNKKMNCVIDRSNMKHSARNAKYELKYQAYYLFIPSLATQKHLNTTQHPANSN